MARKRKPIESTDDHSRWLLTYADLITLLLAFFIVMYSMSRIDAKKFGRMSNALQGVLRGQESIIPKHSIINRSEWEGGGPLKIGDLRLMQARLQQAIVKAKMEDKITPTIDERGLVVHVTESALFDEAQADLKKEAWPTLSLVARSLKGLAEIIRVEGHTDSRPIKTGRFPSNWELSTARAATVVRFFVGEHGWEPHRISALGYGEFRPLKPNDTPENMAQNRRVDIVVLAASLSLSEPAGLPYTYRDTIGGIPPLGPVGPEP
jgi:chemotaxis protein MotB